MRAVHVFIEVGTALVGFQYLLQRYNQVFHLS